MVDESGLVKGRFTEGHAFGVSHFQFLEEGPNISGWVKKNNKLSGTISWLIWQPTGATCGQGPITKKAFAGGSIL